MYLDASDLFNQIIRQPVKSYRARLTCGDEVVDSGFVSATLTGGSTNNSAYQLGANVSAQLDVTITDTTTVFVGKWWTYEIGVKVDLEKDYDDLSAYEFIPMGVFKVQEQSKSNGKRMFTAYDRMSEMNSAFNFDSEELTAYEVIDLVAIQCGVTIDKTGIVNDTLTQQSGFTCKDILGAIAMLNGRSVYADRYGNIVFKKYEHQTTDYTASDTRGFSADEQNFSFTCIAGVTGGIIIGENEQSEVRLLPTNADTSGNTLLFYNPFFTQALLDRLYENDIALWSYNVATVPLALGDIRLDPWDVVNVYDSNLDEYIVPCMSLVQSYNGGLTTQIQSFGEEQGNAEEGYISPYKRLQDAITTALLTVERLVAQSAQIAGFEINDTGLSASFKNDTVEFKINSSNGEGFPLPCMSINGEYFNMIVDDSRLITWNGDTFARLTNNGLVVGKNYVDIDKYASVTLMPTESISIGYDDISVWSGGLNGSLKSLLKPRNLKLTNGTNSSGFSGYFKCYEVYGLVHILGNVTINGITSTGTYVIGKVPSGYEPSYTTVINGAFNLTSGNVKCCWVGTNGNINVYVDAVSSGSTLIRINGMWYK